MIAFRCPTRLMEKITELSKVQGKSRTRVITEAIRLLARTVKEREGRVVPPYDGPEQLSEMDFGPQTVPGPRKRRKKRSSKTETPKRRKKQHENHD